MCLTASQTKTKNLVEYLDRQNKIIDFSSVYRGPLYKQVELHRLIIRCYRKARHRRYFHFFKFRRVNKL